ncbi:MAG: sugar ABC transporter permease [Mesorhizobium sp.]|uniref:carbohydrate ABC transporter permease n=1 Tax=unclassified Mesorhizobium TaxID=325217 RepID=UPI000BAE87E4|nr:MULTISPECIES: sugar ABC transporter permease [unclassified Mesorhizobium]PBB29223.1 sugar ABC transporter permease [Mesorhizobium sp. WSM3882]RUV45865.1 sugar ABC transporter permease [Mesorhizobium sp. M1A.T.Ca.IN.004.03.1.1]RUV84082.1 sugar ABC transporter permease [Mesorhizobium sp. M1A.F.Ca.IN.020.32.1.1]RUW14597.1 sugar ABC transporter permease [Mesorhizobium sp. M1A.F.Ca.IN.022.05.2.1]RUW17374.1 sugar ABC transporter permease [Mesorhizobium sp. M1A.F.Ca.IN.020.06.1.1]
MPPVWRRNRHWLTPVLFLLPGLILFGSVILAASIETVWISLHDWDGIGAKTWVGLANYVELADDPQFYVSLKNNVIWLLIFMLAPPTGLALALIVNQQIRGMRILKSLFFVPLVLATVTVGVVFGWVYDPNFGLLQLLFGAFGGTAPALLSDETFVTFAVAAAGLWPQIAFCMILFLAGLNSLNDDLIAAGRVDGARGWRMLRHVVLPQLSQVGFIAIAVTVIGALRSFDMIAVMTSGGPYGSSTVLAYQMYQESIFSYRFGYGAAIATVLFVIMIVFIAWYLSGLIKAERSNA